MDDIIARKPSSPLGTSLILITTFALLSAIVLAIMGQNSNANEGKTVTETIKSYDTPFNSSVAKIEKSLKANAISGSSTDSAEEDTDSSEEDEDSEG